MEEERNSSSPVKAKAKTVSNDESLRISTSSSWTILPTERIETLDNSNASDTLLLSTSTSAPAGTAAVASTATDEQNQQGEQQELPVEQRELKEQGGSSKDNNDEQINERCKLAADIDNQAEDVSDGISIISDCESTGRISPHPYMREHLPEFTYKFNSGMPTSPLSCCMPCVAEHELRERHLEIGLGMKRRQVETQTQTTMQHTEEEEQQQQQQQLVGHRLPPMVQSGLTAVFYVAVTLAILAFMGRLRNPEWQVIGMDHPLGDLEQKLIELELQNNLMRAEIDIMSKQLQYLNGLSGGGQGHAQSQSQSQSQHQGRKGKTFKAWPGNGNSVNPVDITKEDLKRPFQCANGKYVEIAAMCMESMPHAESLADEIGNVVNDVLQKSPAFQSFEKVTEQLGTLAGNDDESTVSDTKFKAFHAQGDKLKPIENDGKEAREQNPYFKQNAASSKERYKTKYNHKHEHAKEHSKDSQSKEHAKGHLKNHSKEHKDYAKAQSREHRRFQNSNEQDSKENYYWKHADISKEKAKKSHGHDDNSDGSGEWHERMMQHREHSRQRHEQKRNNNWYIERGGSREQKRSG